MSNDPNRPLGTRTPYWYAERQISGRKPCIDHVTPQSLREFNSYRNLVSCCVECTSWKGAHAATDFLRWLYRQDRLTAVELTQRFRALKRLAAGKLRPSCQKMENRNWKRRREGLTLQNPQGWAPS